MGATGRDGERGRDGPVGDFGAIGPQVDKRKANANYDDFAGTCRTARPGRCGREKRKRGVSGFVVLDENTHILAVLPVS